MGNDPKILTLKDIELATGDIPSLEELLRSYSRNMSSKKTYDKKRKKDKAKILKMLPTPEPDENIKDEVGNYKFNRYISRSTSIDEDKAEGDEDFEKMRELEESLANDSRVQRIAELRKKLVEKYPKHRDSNYLLVDKA